MKLTSDDSSDEKNEDVVNNPPSSKGVLSTINILRDFFPNNFCSHDPDNMENWNMYKQFNSIQNLTTAFFRYEH